MTARDLRISTAMIDVIRTLQSTTPKPLALFPVVLADLRRVLGTLVADELEREQADRSVVSEAPLSQEVAHA